MNFNHALILASNSPRRHELLRALGFEFAVKVKSVDESFPNDTPVSEVASYLAQKKAKAYLGDLIDNEVVITADTVVINKGEILGKPKDRKEAYEMLKSLSGSHHSVMTGVCITSKNQQVTFDDTTIVYFKSLTEKKINDYIDNYKPFDKAGAYGIQEILPTGIHFLSSNELDFLKEIGQEQLVKPLKHDGKPIIEAIEKIEGSYFNVMGLPLQKLYRNLKQF